jgi:hypothetical protein
MTCKCKPTPLAMIYGSMVSILSMSIAPSARATENGSGDHPMRHWAPLFYADGGFDGPGSADPAPPASPPQMEVQVVQNMSVAEQLKQLSDELRSQREQLKAQTALIAAQQNQIRQLNSAVQMGQVLAEVRGTGVGELASLQATSTVQTVGEAPPADHEMRNKVQSLPEGQGVLTPRGRTVLESSFEYTRSSANRLVFRGIELVPGLQLGLIEATTAERDTLSGAITVRRGLTNRLEIEARMPVLYRRDRIQVVQQRNQGIVREIKLSRYDIGDAEIAVRYQINTPKRPSDGIFVGSLRLKSATGTGPFDVNYDQFGIATGLATGSGFWALQPGINFLLPSDPAVIYGGLSYLWHIPRHINKNVGGAFVGKVDPGDAISASLGFGFALNPRFSFSLGYSHSYIFPSKTEIGGTNQRSKALQVGSFNFGTSYRLSERQSVNFGFEFGVTSDAPDVAVTLRLPLMF